MSMLDTIGYIFLVLQLYLFTIPSKSVTKLFIPEKLAFLSGIVGSSFIALFGIQICSYPTIIMNLLAIFLNFKGFHK